MKVLLLEGDYTQALPTAETLHKNGFEVHSFCSDKFSYGYNTRYVDYKVICGCDTMSEKDYLAFVINYIVEHKIDTIIPIDDSTALIMSKYQEELSKVVKFISPSYGSFILGYDKNQLMKICSDFGFPHPKTLSLPDTISVNWCCESSFFPAIIKPNITSGGRGMTVVNSLPELKLVYPQIFQEFGACHLQEYIMPGGKQIKVQIYVDKNTNLVCSSVIHKQRFYPEKGGSSCCNITINNEKLVELCYQVLKVLKWRGFADFDLIEDPKDGELKIMELNPRLPACIKSAVKSGVDYGLIIANDALGLPLPTIKYTPGKSLRHLGFDTLWFFYSKNRFKTTPNWFRFFGRDIYYQDLDIKDIKSFIWGSWGNIKKQFDPNFRKLKSGMRK